LKKHPNFRHTAEANKKRNEFNFTKLFNRRMKLNPQDEYTVYNVNADFDDTDLDMNRDILDYDDIDDPEVFA
jgi:type IV secretion system protein VirD4